ncbi:MAG TPA: FtsQ-type POTRA domain-containing protein [Acidobacteriota bacterium]|nr:FtsQ-type POTRA domain-containing protein [Acidobacteriota bacterium]
MSRDPHFLRPGHGVERSKARRKRRFLLVSALALILIGAAFGMTLAAYQFLTNPESFKVSEILIEGAEFASHAEIAETVRQLTAGNVLLVDLQQVRAAVEAHPWVREARVRKVLPDTLQITVDERHPTALVILQGEIFLTDGSGILIDRFRPEHPFIGLPLIGAVDGLEPEERTNRLRLATDMLGDLKLRRPDWFEVLSEIYVAPLKKMKLRLNSIDCDFFFDGGRGDLVDSLEKYFSVEASIHRLYNKIDYIDLRFDRRLVIKSATGGQGG